MFVERLLRGLARAVVHCFYRLSVVSEANVPPTGPALLVANHLSLADGFLIGAALKRPVRFLIWRPYFDAVKWNWFLRRMQCIPISEKDSPKDILRSLMGARKALEAGELVCLFAEGQISRTGNLLEFKRGFEVIVKDMTVPVIPVHLDRIWGSIFSFEGGRVIFKWPRRIPYPVTVTFGAPVAPPVNAEHVRQSVMDLGAEAFRRRMEDSGPLVLEFLKRAKKQPFALAMADSMGKTLSFSRLAAAGLVLSEVIRKAWAARTKASPAAGTLAPEVPDPMGQPIGLLVPPSVGGALTNLAVALLGAIPVHLNYTAGAGAIDHAAGKAGIRLILASRRLLQKVGLPERPDMVFLEDVAPRVSKAKVLALQVLFAAIPTSWALARWGRRAARQSLDDTATIIFSSGSTGVPKGAVLTHANILSNILGISQVFDLGTRDRMIGVLPFFHSFGFTVTLWFPLIKGFGMLYHTNPMEAKIIGEMAEKHQATVLLATPTFLNAYTRKCRPEQFRRLRHVITGAERMRESVARAFEEKFGIPPMEGYGCTELSPVATVNVPNVSMGEIRQVGNKPGKIGHPIPGVSVRIVDPESFAERPQNEPGMLLVKGPNVMKGYLGEPEKTAAVIRDGWYITGDIAKIDQDGFIQIVDRLNRFSKIGGEMVPHMLLEEKLHQLAGVTESAFAVTAVPDDKKGERLVVLYVRPKPRVEDGSAPSPGGSGMESETASEAPGWTLDGVLQKLKESDLPKLWLPDRDSFFEVESLPMLGTGKLDLQKLKSIALERAGADAHALKSKNPGV